MVFLINIMLLFLNLGLIVGLMLGALVLLRPLLLRLLRPQQRVVLWAGVWIMAYMPSAYGVTNYIRALPITFRDLVVPRTGGVYELPAYLPDLYQWAGEYRLALPGGMMFPVSLSVWSLFLMEVVWIGGIAVLGWISYKKSRALRAVAEQGTPLPEDDPVFREECGRLKTDVAVYLCSDLPTSFVALGKITDNLRTTICLQDHLPREQMHLVLRHEVEHIRLRHCLFKVYASFAIYLFWWNPLVWLGHRYFCQDMELACDEAVLKRLEGEERRAYARTLVELGSGRQLWESALSFGECDAALRVKAAVAWKPWRWWRWGLSWSLVLLVMLFFMGGPNRLRMTDDEELYYQRYAAAQPAVFSEMTDSIVDWAGGEPGEQMLQVWIKAHRDNVASWLWVETQEGGWYQVGLIQWGKKPMLLQESAKQLDTPPDLADACRILPP